MTSWDKVKLPNQTALVIASCDATSRQNERGVGPEQEDDLGPKQALRRAVAEEQFGRGSSRRFRKRTGKSGNVESVFFMRLVGDEGRSSVLTACDCCFDQGDHRVPFWRQQSKRDTWSSTERYRSRVFFIRGSGPQGFWLWKEPFSRSYGGRRVNACKGSDLEVR